jgi:hypothetical protein
MRLPAALLVALTLSAPAPAQVATLSLQSQPGDFIGQGQTVTNHYPTGSGDTISAQIRRSLPDGSPAELEFVVGQSATGPNVFATLFFGTDQLGLPMQPGVYGLPGNTAQRADFAQPGHAGLDVTYQNRGSNTLTGNFTVTAASFVRDAAGLHIGSFAASFEQHSEGATPALFGQFSYSAVPEPPSLALLGGAALGLLGSARRRSR